MNQSKALALGLMCLLAVAGLASVLAGQDKAATSQPAAEPAGKGNSDLPGITVFAARALPDANGATSAPAAAPTPPVAPAPTTPIATSAPAAATPPVVTPTVEPVPEFKLEPGKVARAIALQKPPAGIKPGDRVNVFVANDNTLTRILDGVAVLAIGGESFDPQTGGKGPSAIVVAVTKEKSLEIETSIASAKGGVFLELAPAAAPSGEVKPAGTTPPGDVAAVPAPKPPEPPKIAPLKLDAFAHGKNFTALPDQEIVVEFKSSTATPLELTKIDGASVQQVGKIEFKPKAEGAKDGVYTATFKAGKEGKSTIQLQSLIEAGKPGKMEIKFTVTVAAAAAGG